MFKFRISMSFAALTSALFVVPTQAMDFEDALSRSTSNQMAPVTENSEDPFEQYRIKAKEYENDERVERIQGVKRGLGFKHCCFSKYGELFFYESIQECMRKVLNLTEEERNELIFATLTLVEDCSQRPQEINPTSQLAVLRLKIFLFQLGSVNDQDTLQRFRFLLGVKESVEKAIFLDTKHIFDHTLVFDSIEFFFRATASMDEEIKKWSSIWMQEARKNYGEQKIFPAGGEAAYLEMTTKEIFIFHKFKNKTLLKQAIEDYQTFKKHHKKNKKLKPFIKISESEFKCRKINVVGPNTNYREGQTLKDMSKRAPSDKTHSPYQKLAGDYTGPDWDSTPQDSTQDIKKNAEKILSENSLKAEKKNAKNHEGFNSSSDEDDLEAEINNNTLLKVSLRKKIFDVFQSLFLKKDGTYLEGDAFDEDATFDNGVEIKRSDLIHLINELGDFSSSRGRGSHGVGTLNAIKEIVDPLGLPEFLQDKEGPQRQGVVLPNQPIVPAYVIKETRQNLMNLGYSPKNVSQKLAQQQLSKAASSKPKPYKKAAAKKGQKKKGRR